MSFKLNAAGLTFALMLSSGLMVSTHAAEQFIPQGHVYGPNSEQLPALNSTQDQIDAMADIRETEIWKSQHRERLFLQQLDRLIDHDLTTPNSVNALWGNH
ncbi:hypothetical protein FHS85_003105 [Rhodoligotrophos appendicifer]|uniref:hypothetical protein n=1 Tax=Rhodoligotrophos appendicifer TaxID=987056 RepID=UPI0011861F9A|nr:hypothetical protein [Rhodoligotrophos appendicifer]